MFSNKIIKKSSTFSFNICYIPLVHFSYLLKKNVKFVWLFELKAAHFIRSKDSFEIVQDIAGKNSIFDENVNNF